MKQAIHLNLERSYCEAIHKIWVFRDIKRAMKTNVFLRKGKLSEHDRSFDVEFWQSQPPKARFDAAWELVVHAARVKGQDVRQLRLQRLVTNFQRQER